MAEDAGDTSVTVTASMGGNQNAPADMPVTVTFGNSLDSATSGTDYEAVDPFKITIPQGSKSATKTITFTPKDDTLAEDDETITLTGKTPKTSVGSTHLKIDDDDDTGITLTAKPVKVSEGAGATKVTVTAKTDGTTFPAPRYVNVQVGKTGDGATEGTDYKTVADFTVTIPFAKTQGTGTFTLTPVDDSTLESDESISISGSTSASDTVKGTSVTLEDNEASITLAAAPKSVTEDGGAKTVTVTATAASAVEADTALTIAVGESGDSATEGTDYSTVADFTLTIKAGKTQGTGTFTLTPTDDDLYEGGSESLTVSGKATNARVGTATVAITDATDNEVVEVSLSLKPTRVKECGADTEVWVSAKLPDSDEAVPEDRTITVSVGKSGNKEATSGTDYTAVKDFDLTIPAGHRSGLASFELKPIDDHDAEGDETITVHGTAKRLTVKNEPKMTLVDDDQPIVILTMDPAIIPENDTVTSVTVTASLFSGDFCGKTHNVSSSARSSSSMESIAVSMVGASAEQIAKAVLGPKARAVSANSATTVAVAVGDTGDTAISGTDYTAVSNFTVSIAAGKTKGTATFTTTASLDNLLEPSETMTVKGASTGTTVTPAGGHVANKDQVNATLTVSPSSLSESAGDTTMTVTVSTGGVTSSQRFEVPIRVSGGTATAGTDFAKVTDFDLVLAANTTSGTGTFTLTPTDDTLVEGDETLNVTIPNTTLSAAVTLTDNDDGTITLSVSPSSVPEGSGDETVTVTAATNGSTFPADRTVTVTVGDSKDGATEGTDYTTVSDFDITITKGQTSGSATFTLTPTQDTVIEGNETLSVKGTSTGVTVNGTSVTITDDDSSDITLRVSPSSVTEGAEATEVTVTAVTDGDTFSGDRTVTVSIGDTKDSATSGTDYAAVADLDITIKAGKTKGSGKITLTPKQDTLVEGDESISVEGTSTGLTVNGTSMTIGDDDTKPEVNLTVNPTSVLENAGATSVTVTAAFSNSSTYGEAKTVSVAVGYGSDSATEGTDYASVADFNISIAAGSGSGTGTFTLTPTSDRIIEGDEKITVGGKSTGLTVNDTELTITDDDQSEITLTVSPSSLSEGAAATTVTVTAATDGDTFPVDKTVSVTVGDSNDSATSGTDYAAVAGFDITISASKTSGSATFTLTPTSDTLVEGNETISVDGTSTGLTVNNTSVTISDDDSVPAINLTVNPSSLSEEDSATSVTVTATFSNSSTYAVDKTIAVSVGDANDSATSGTDYAAVTDFDITISKGNTSGTATFTLTPTSDTLVEGNEIISVDGSSTGLTVNGANITLTDDDGAPAINLSLNPSSVSESAAATSVKVKAIFSNSNTYAADKTVSVTVGDSKDSATSGTDYAAVTTFDITIAAGKTSGTANFTLTPTNDTLIEGNETISVDGTSSGMTVNGTSVTLSDDDGTPAINLSLNPSSVSESASGTTVAVTAKFSNSSTYGAAKTVSVTVGDSKDSATSGTDYAAVTGFDITIAAGKTSGTANFTLTPTNDTLVEGNESISVDGTSSGLTVNGASATLTDDDSPPTIDLSAKPSSVSEDDSATTVKVTATFSNSSTYGAAKTVAVTVGKSGDSATSGTDYAAVTGFDITIAAGKTSGTANFTLTPTDDTSIEGDETITVDGTNADLTVKNASVTLEDDDTTKITLTAKPTSVKEEDSGTTVTVTAATDGDTFPTDTTVRVKVGKVGDSATSGTDYSAVNPFDITIKKNKSSGTGTFTLTPTDDNIIEGDESLTVSGVSSGLTVESASLTIKDNEKPKIILDMEPYLEANPDKLPENAGATRVTVTAGTEGGVFDLDREIYVTVGKDGDSAVFGTDWDTPLRNFHVKITAGETEGKKTFTLTPTDDDIVEGDESLTLEGSAAGLEVTTETIIIEDNDVPGMSLAASPESVSEDAGDTTVTVTAATGGVTFTADRTVSVTVGGEGDSATSGTDYAAVTAFDVTITKGQTEGSGTFTLTPTNDDLIEDGETITLSGATSDYTVSGTSLTLSDDDKTVITLSASPESVSESDSATTVTVTAATDGKVFSADRTVTLTIGDSEDSATSGTDYAAVDAFEITITAGKTSGTGTFTLTPTDDTEIEGNETISVAGTSGNLTVSGTSVTLTDDDSSGVTLAVNPESVSEGAGESTVTVTATTDGDTFKTDVTVTVSAGASEDSATSGTDYAAVTSFDLTITAGETSGEATFTLTPTDDTLVEGDETITVSGASGELTVSGTSLTLSDNDNPALSLTLKPSSVKENDSATSVTVTVSTGGVTYNDARTVTLSVGKSDDSATSGTDYESVNDFKIDIKAGETSGTGTFTLTPKDDQLIEGNETISVSGVTESIGSALTTLTLTDDEAGSDPTPDPQDPEGESQPQRLPTIYLSASPSSVAEEGGAETIYVTAQVENGLAFQDDRTVTVSVGSGGDSSDWGDDYEAVSDFTITIRAGQNSGGGSFTLSPIDDRVIEGDESISISGSSPGEPAVSVSGTSLTLVDDDYTEITLTVDPTNLPEYAGATEVTVKAETDGDTFKTERTITVSVGAEADSAVSGKDYETVSDFTITIAVGETSGTETFTLTPVDDTTIEDEETISISGSSPGLTVHGTSMTLEDDDPLHRASVEDVSAEEGQPLVFKVTLDRVVGDNVVTLRYDTFDGTATAGEDYEAASGTLTFPPGESSGTVEVQTIDDAMDEGPETLFLKLSEPVNIVLDDAEAIGTILNDDAMPRAWIARYGRTVARHVMDAVDDRLHGEAGESHLTVTGVTALGPSAFPDSGIPGRWQASAGNSPGNSGIWQDVSEDVSPWEESAAEQNQLPLREVLAQSSFLWKTGGGGRKKSRFTGLGTTMDGLGEWRLHSIRWTAGRRHAGRRGGGPDHGAGRRVGSSDGRHGFFEERR